MTPAPIDVERIDASDARAFEEWFAVWHEMDLERWPDRPGWQRVERQAMALDREGPIERQCLVAHTDGRAVGVADLEMFRRENGHVARIDVRVLPAWRRRGVGSALVAFAEGTAARTGRTEVGGMDQTPTREDYVDSAGSFARRLGFEPVQRVTHRRLSLPLTVAHEEALRRHPKATPTGYTLLTFVDGWPEQYVEDRCELGRRMSTDVPMGEQEWEEEVWDAQRLRDLQATLEAQNRAIVITAARDDESGRLVAFTELAVPLGAPESAWQWDTLVLREHRGHGLGFAVKLANLRATLTRHPGVRCINTQNAEDNAPMIAINDEMGFEVAAHSVEWRRNIGPEAKSLGSASG
jgi:GNAT superfamily N-acetyltransferase